MIDETIAKIAVLLDCPMEEVARQCQIICSHSPLPSSNILPRIYMAVSSGKRLDELIQESEQNMSEQNKVISWLSTPEKEKTRLILEVLGYYLMPETCYVQGHFTMPEEITDFNWPFAYWRDDRKVWVVREMEESIFDPLHDMNDTLRVITYKQFDSVELKRYWHEGGGLPYGCHIIYGGVPYHAYAYTMQESVCMAALKTAGYEIEG